MRDSSYKSRRSVSKTYVRQLEDGAWAIAFTFVIVGGALGFFFGVCIAHVAKWGDMPWCR